MRTPATHHQRRLAALLQQVVIIFRADRVGGFPQLTDIMLGPVRIPTLFTLIFIAVVMSVVLARNLVYSSYGRAWLSVRASFSSKIFQSRDVRFGWNAS